MAGPGRGRRGAGDVGQSRAPDTVDAGVLAGLGADLGALVLDARVEAGVLDADRRDERSRAVTLTLGYRL